MIHRTYLFLTLLAVHFVSPITLAGAIPDGPNQRITDSGLVQYRDAELPSMAVRGDTLYATWLDDRFGNDNAVMFAKSDDGGDTWSDNVRVSLLPYDDWTDNPRITVQPDGTIWVVWYLFYAADSNKANDIRIARSTDGGVQWDTFLLKDGGDQDDLWKTRIASDDEYVYILYHDYKNTAAGSGYDIVLNRIDTERMQHGDVVVNDTPRTGRSNGNLQDDGPTIDLSLRETENGTVLCAAWEDTRSRGAIYGACSADRGASFSANFNISGDDGVNPHIAVAPDGRLYSAYSLDTDGDNNIVLRHSDDRGQNWSAPKPVTQLSNGEVDGFDLGVDRSGQVVIPWIHDSGGSFSSSNVNLATSSDGGDSFANLMDLEDEQGDHPNTSNQYQVNLAIGPGEGQDERVYLAWQDTRNSEDEIWFTRALLDGTPPTRPKGLTLESADRAVHLSWQAATDAHGVQAYRVYRAEQENGPFQRISARPVQGLEYTDVGLEPGELHYYRVAAVDGTGNLGPRSDVVGGSATLTHAAPEGTLIYESDEAVRLTPLAGGDGQTLGDASDPRLAPDGSRLYYRAGGNIAVRSIEAQGQLGDAQTFLSREGLSEFDIAADHRHFGIIAVRSQFNADLGTCFVSEPIFGTDRQDLFTDQFNHSSYPSISADHHWLAYRYDGYCNGLSYGISTPGDFCLANLGTQQAHCLEGANVNGSDFAPSGHRLVMAAPWSGQHEVWVANVSNDGGLVNHRQLTRGPANQPVDNPRWSDDGEWIVFQRDLDPNTDEEATDWRLFAVRVDGTALRDLERTGEDGVLRTGATSQPDDDAGTDSSGNRKSGGALSIGLLSLLGLWLTLVRIKARDWSSD